MQISKSIFMSAYLAIALHFIRKTYRKLLSRTEVKLDAQWHFVQVSLLRSLQCTHIPLSICANYRAARLIFNALNSVGLPGIRVVLETPTIDISVKVTQAIQANLVIHFIDNIKALPEVHEIVSAIASIKPSSLRN